MFQRFTERARRAVVLAQEEARLLGHNYIGTEHLLLGQVHEAEGIAARALETMGIGLDSVRQKVVDLIGHDAPTPSGHIPFTPPAKAAFELSLREAMKLGHNYIGTEHILLGLIKKGEGVAAQVLKKLGADLPKVRDSVIELVDSAESEGPTNIVDELTGRMSGTAPTVGVPGTVVGHINPLRPGPRDLGLLILLIAGVLAGDSGSSLYSAGSVAAIVGVVLATIRSMPWPWRHDDRWARVVRIPAVLALGIAAVLFFASAI